jgi:hypothetical protein
VSGEATGGRCFGEGDPLARYGDADVERLLANPSIIRNRRKFEATLAIPPSLPSHSKGGHDVDSRFRRSAA